MDAARYWVEPLEGELIGDPQFNNKIGFCMFESFALDATLPGAPNQVTHPIAGCRSKENETLLMGISIGWSDIYRSHLEGQYIDIAGLPPSNYGLLTSVNPDGVFRETDFSNNFAWMVFRLGEPATAGGPPVLTELGQDTSYVRD